MRRNLLIYEDCQEIDAQLILVFLNSLSLSQSKLYLLFEHVGSLSIIFLA